MLDTIDDVIVDAYNTLREELTRAKAQLRELSDQKGAPSVLKEPAQGKVAASGSGYTWDRTIKRWIAPDCHPWDILVEVSADNPLGQNARCVINDLKSRLKELSNRSPFSDRCASWVAQTHGIASQNHLDERVARFIEEAIELAQACDMSEGQVDKINSYVYGRVKGSIRQELGGVMVCLGALASCVNLDMDMAGETELKRCHEHADAIRAKGYNKPAAISPLNRDHSK